MLIANVSSGYGYFVTSSVVLQDLGFCFSKLDPKLSEKKFLEEGGLTLNSGICFLGGVYS
jgi:hypothetical protein